MIPNVSQIISKPLIFPNSGKGLVSDTFSGKPIFHNCTKHFPNESRIFYKLWKEPIFASELVIKKFYREAHLWQEFWDSFKSSIDDNKNLSTIHKSNYLKNLLESNAYSTIAGLSLTVVNYSTALDLLHKRYGKKQIIL